MLNIILATIQVDYSCCIGEYPDLNRKHTMPHTVVLPIELYSPMIIFRQ